MSTKDYSAKLLEMEGVRIENLEESEHEIVLQISLVRRVHVYGRCTAGGGTLPRLWEALPREKRFCRAIHALLQNAR